MIFESANGMLYAYVGAWLIAPVALFVVLSRRRRLPGVLVFAYLLAFFMNHWPGALVHASPWAEFLTSQDTLSGFILSTHALFTFVLGAMLWRGGGVSQLQSTRFGSRAIGASSWKAMKRVAPYYVLLGAAFWLATFTPLAALPSASAILSGGQNLVLLGVCLHLWGAWQEGSSRKLATWSAVALVLPVVTVMTRGFIGYGIAMLGVIIVFAAMFYRPRSLLAVGLLVGVYGAMSVWVGYAAQRNTIRDAVWGGQDFDARWGAVSAMIGSLRWFDLANQDHLKLVDARLNQNWLVGQAMVFTPETVPFENGKTLTDAVVAIVPRALWPDKPPVGGSGDYVARHTMQEFADGTSVGMGQVLELYINFGTESVLIGFFLLGAFLRALDARMMRAMVQGRVKDLQLYFVVGSGALQAGGSLAEMVASMGGGAVISLVVSRIFAWRTARDRRLRQRAATKFV